LKEQNRYSIQKGAAYGLSTGTKEKKHLKNTGNYPQFTGNQQD
jgi:hypothetical protein